MCFSSAWFYVNPVPSFRFWSGCKNKYRLCQSKQASGAKSDAEMVLVCLFARVIQQLGFWTENSSQRRRLLLCLTRAEGTSLGPGLKHPSLR